jgi:galactokinase
MLMETIPGARYLATAPGRVNLLGEHVDYNDGAVLPVAIDRRVQLAARPHNNTCVELQALDLGKNVSFDIYHLDEKTDLEGTPLPAWARYPAGVAWALQKKGLAVQGFSGAFTSDIPIGAGLSSSAALEVAFAVLWRQLGDWQASAMDLAQACLEAEVHYVGVNCGLMDQFSSAHGREGNVLYLDTRSLNWEAVPLPAGTVIIVADSKVKRSLATSGYNERHTACEQAVTLLQTRLPSVRALRDVSLDDFRKYAHVLPEVIRRRAQHVIEECARVEEALVYLKTGDAKSFGRLMVEGHASLRDLYEVSCPELDALVEIACQQPGCLGARLTGAGFGGCTVNLVAEEEANRFTMNLKTIYEKTTGQTTDVFVCQASDGARVQAIG